MNLVEIVETSLEKAYNNESNIDVYNIVMEGMSGLKTRHFYNNLGSHEGARYLEIGTWVGSSICSFMKGNKSKCVCIDNWSEIGGPKDIFMTHFNEHKGDNDATFIESNCWDVDPKTLGKFNIYMYDGAHDKESHHRALSHFMEALDEEFIYIVDDWNVEHIRQGTEDALISNNLEVIYKKEIFTDRNPGIQKGKLLNDWHNGIVVYVLRKTE